jgi:dGTPase
VNNFEEVEAALSELSMYKKLLIVTDYVSGMTDRFAVDLYHKLSGLRLF